jgi:hypothetical protein
MPKLFNRAVKERLNRNSRQTATNPPSQTNRWVPAESNPAMI